MGKKNTVLTFRQAKENGEKLTMLTAYDYSTAKLIDEAGVNSILVGDSLGNVILGYEDTIPVTMEDMIHHGAAVSRGTKNATLPNATRTVPKITINILVIATNHSFFVYHGTKHRSEAKLQFCRHLPYGKPYFQQTLNLLCPEVP